MLRPPFERICIFLLKGTWSLLHGQRPSGYRSAAYVVLGFVRGLRQPLDVRARIYRRQPVTPRQVRLRA